MDIGIGLPSTIPGIPGRLIMQWASAAEQAGFSSLGTLDRVVYGNMETVPVLAAAAAVTERIGLTTAILIGPYRGNGALLAKQLATVDRIAEGRLQLGIAVGGRPDDFEATGSPFGTRGRDFDAQLAQMRAVWAQEPRGFAGAIGPAPVRPGGPPMLFGGNADAALRRMTEFGDGWIMGGGGPEAFAAGAQKARAAWTEAGRAGQPRLAALSYVSLGENAESNARSYLSDYYAFAGPYAARVADGALTSPQKVAHALEAFSEAGCDELILFPCIPDIAQVALTARAAGLLYAGGAVDALPDQDQLSSVVRSSAFSGGSGRSMAVTRRLSPAAEAGQLVSGPGGVAVVAVLCAHRAVATDSWRTLRPVR